MQNSYISIPNVRLLNFVISYGYVTNTKIKFVIIVESSNNTLRDNEIRNVSEKCDTFGFEERACTTVLVE